MMRPEKLLADISRIFCRFKRLQDIEWEKISDMRDNEIISCCHFYCEENNLISEWENYRAESESEYRIVLCVDLKKYQIV